ncbi:MAG: N-methyl-L-tryptophan oxidase [Phycisphaerae bacterium]|nr:N-methyl-L-tryptophan oxidase [Phycisphaerae bacterium]
MAGSTYDAIVVGLGAMGSAVAAHLARRRQRVLGLDRYVVPHELGSSHGRSRVIRKAYFEDPRYVPLLHRAFDLWRDLQAESGESLLTITGVVNIGPPDHACIRGVLDSVTEHGLVHDVRAADEITARFPALRPEPGDVGVFEAEAGVLCPERCIAAHLRTARRFGAEILMPQRVTSIRSDGAGVHVATECGTYSAGHAIVAAGPWLPAMLSEGEAAAIRTPGRAWPLLVERQVQFWFEPQNALLVQPPGMPVFIHFVEERAYYGVPMLNSDGVKICRHHGGATTDVESVDRAVSTADEEDVRSYVRRYVPVADGRLLEAKVCLYTNTPDAHFVIGSLPGQEQVLVVSACSGHGFKFSAVVGEMVADLVMDGRTRFEVGMFSPGRFD